MTKKLDPVYFGAGLHRVGRGWRRRAQRRLLGFLRAWITD